MRPSGDGSSTSRRVAAEDLGERPQEVGLLAEVGQAEAGPLRRTTTVAAEAPAFTHRHRTSRGGDPGRRFLAFAADAR
jgi:hypothetical protein